MHKKPLISIVIPCFNDFLYVGESVRSAINQTYPLKQVIVVDDGSNQKTKKALQKIEHEIDLLIRQENQGLSAARNAGINAAQGELILVQDSDDFFHPHFCEEAVEQYQQIEHCKIVTCQALRFNENGIIDIYSPRGGELENFLFSNSAIGNSLFSKKDWEAINGYDEKMTDGFEDWEFFLRLLKSGGLAFVIQKPLFNYRQKKSSMRMEANKVKYDLWEYIFLKHRELYIEHFDLLINHFTTSLKREEKEKIKNTKRLEFTIGTEVLRPLRFLKSFLK